MLDPGPPTVKDRVTGRPKRTSHATGTMDDVVISEDRKLAESSPQPAEDGQSPVERRLVVEQVAGEEDEVNL